MILITTCLCVALGFCARGALRKYRDSICVGRIQCGHLHAAVVSILIMGAQINAILVSVMTAIGRHL